MIAPDAIRRMILVIRNHLVGVVALTGKVVAAFVTAVFAGLGAGLVLGVTLALIAALGLAGIRVQADDLGVADEPSVVIDVTPRLV
ncbi:hypothetical protein GC170_17605 [bacterium]|nr:hypothetical protein [bacterium]